MRTLVRAVAVTGIAAAFATPVLRRRFKVPPTATVAATAAGPIGLAILCRRTKTRDAALFALQMWGFMVAHELPYDDPDRLRERLRIQYPIQADRMIGAGVLPNTRLQRALARPRLDVSSLDRLLTWTHWVWFFEPHLSLIYILTTDNPSFARAARQMSAAYDLGCATYFAVPTAPPWWAAENGYTGDDEVERRMIRVGEEVWGEKTWDKLYDFFGGNPWAAMPSLHFGASVLAATLLTETNKGAGAVGWAYAGTLGIALVYLGEHYVTDLLAGLLLVAVVRGGEPVVEPLALAFSRGVQRLEEIAAS